MDEYISRKDAEDAVRACCLEASACNLQCIKDIPAADVREVVLCKECFFYKGDTMFCSLHEADFAKDAFCSYATTNAKAEYWGLGKEGHDRRHDADTREIDDDNTF